MALQSSVLVEPILVGRKHELEQLHQDFNSVIKGKGKAVFVSGRAGSGKSRLVDEFLESIKEAEPTILSGWCLSNAAVPYFPFIEAFDEYYSHCLVSVEDSSLLKVENSSGSGKYSVNSEELTIRDWLNGPKAVRNPNGESHSPLVWKDLAFAAVTKALLSISGKNPTIFVVEDLHWADSASLSLLHYLTRAIVSARVLFIGTFRSEELNSDSEGHPHPLVEVLRLMGRESLYDEIKLADLSRDGVSLIAENMLGGSLDVEFSERLSGESQGNPLFVIESLRMLYEHGGLVQEEDHWRLSIDEFGIPNKIRDVILRRVGALKSSQRRVLDVASVVGEKFDFNLLAAVLNQDSLDVLEVLNTISQATSLVCCEGENYRFDHAKSRETLYEEIPLPLKRGYHSKIAQTLEKTCKNVKELPISSLAYHYVQAGNIPKALKYSLAAGEDALARFSNTEAIRHFRYVLDTISDAPEFASERMTAQEGLADGLFAKGLFEDSMKVYELLGDSAESEIVKLRALRKATAASRWRGELLHSLELAGKASQYAALDRLEYARVLANKGWVYCLRGNAKEGLTELEKALVVFEEEYSPADAASVLTQAAGFGLSFHEFPVEKAMQMGLRSVAILEDLKDFRGQVETYYFLGTVFLNCELSKEAQQAFEKAIKIGEEVADYNHLAWTFLYLALLFESAGDYKEAISVSSKGIEYAEKTDAFYVQSMLYANLVRFYARMGDLARLHESYEKLMKVFPEVERAGSKVAVAVGKRSLALYFAAFDKFPEANALSEESLRLTMSLHYSLFEATLRRDYAWILARQGRSEDAKVQSDEAEKLTRSLKRSFDMIDVQADLMVPREVKVGQEFSMRLDVSNISEKQGTLISVGGLVRDCFRVTISSPNFRLQRDIIEMIGKKLEPFKTESLILKLQASKPGSFNLIPAIDFAAEDGNVKTVKLKQVNVTVRSSDLAENVLPGRISTGFNDLDNILLGGIPEHYAVALTAPASDERELLINHFIEVGAKNGDTTLYITEDIGRARELSKNMPPNFFLFVCNPRAEGMVKNLPNVFKLKGVENLTELDISLLKAFKQLSQNQLGSRRACIEIVSDVLLQHHALITRKWLSGLLIDLKSKGFTTIAVVNPQMHPQEEVQAIMGLFDGEFRVCEKETERGLEKVLRVMRLYNQRYLETGIALTRENLKT